ncbi:GNAT family N-acetyltransferase [Nocardioides sp. JQ2195]|uniref:GNAT family N-acetyltransferase n=1 Tax=Nocardioides sp. JQ2195 TaxID=2592334 RepID=UPI00143E9A7C|nr:GNAT family N-acetyltransferase [Nocardioides sp. JQ2195]QIX27341.1 GNAT family N-acetyltransferase [Nocardioides sp. JQ2195]
MSTVVRTLGPDEWQTWREIRLRSLADAPDAFGSTLAREQAFTEELWRDRMRSSPVVAFVDGVPAAMGGGFQIGDGLVQIIAMWTVPEFRRRGLSKLVLDELVRAIRARGHRVVLDVTRGNRAARTAYEHYGFVATGRAEPLREGSDLLVDEMVLPQ